MGLKKKGKKSKAVATDPRTKGASREAQVLEIVATDNTFHRIAVHPEKKFTQFQPWVGRCIHCNTKLLVSHTGVTDATIEHVLPLVAGGSGSDLQNLALACKKCNNSKGIHHDSKNLSDRAREVIDALLEKRRSRWRERPDHS